MLNELRFGFSNCTALQPIHDIRGLARLGSRSCSNLGERFDVLVFSVLTPVSYKRIILCLL
jgi:hypothetical protein